MGLPGDGDCGANWLCLGQYRATVEACLHGDQFGSLAQDLQMHCLGFAHNAAGRLGSGLNPQLLVHEAIVRNLGLNANPPERFVGNI